MLRQLPFLILFLAAVFALTSVEFASARGQTRAAGQIVLCSGQGLVTVTVDANGTPIRHVKICPDMALALLASLVPTAPALIRPEGMHRFAPAPITARLRGTHSVPPKARDPPASVV
ncbi:hypothetical protein [Thioclava sp. GXIMD4216]|uniref:TonB C-terminal domain-containing protein n=1 Tax=Thioclava litoralis TaxID=3076557 RepID=A0ABZ1DVA5_9RHOB|nr:hypothetical protein RPE78_08075 [Thioclava sp. FTW29]